MSIRTKRPAQPSLSPSSVAALVRLARSAPFGPAWISRDVWEEEAPELVVVVVTRELPGRQILAELVLVDRICLGVREAFLVKPASARDAAERAASMREKPATMTPCDPAFAQSVVLHAVAFARALGFEPPSGFEPALFEPRPTPLIDTPLAKRDRPFYIPRHGDDQEGILRQLHAAVGRDNYDHISRELWFERMAEETDEDEEGIQERTHCRPDPVDVLAEFDLDVDDHLTDAADTLVDLLSKGEYLAWEAVAREERSLPLSDAQKGALEKLFDSDDGDSLDYIEYAPPPHEPWYETFRKIAPRLVIERFETWAPESVNGNRVRRGIELLDAVEKFGCDLSLPDGCGTVRDLLPSELWHRLRVQGAFDVFSGIGRSVGGKAVTLAHADEAHSIGLFRTVLGWHAEDMGALGWTIDDIMRIVVMPPRDRQLVLNELHDIRNASRAAATEGRKANEGGGPE